MNLNFPDVKNVKFAYLSTNDLEQWYLLRIWNIIQKYFKIVENFVTF